MSDLFTLIRKQTYKYNSYLNTLLQRKDTNSVRILLIIFFTVLLISPFKVFAQNEKMHLQKISAEHLPNNIDKDNKLRYHPYITDFSKNTREKNFNQKLRRQSSKLLVILVDFIEDDNPNTTGNGKFITQQDALGSWINSEWNYPESLIDLGYIDGTYPISISSPPYNREYFETVLEAMHYYYRAVSYESFQLEYDVYPKNKQAYTLRKEMAYYNPGLSNYELFVERIELFFKEAFETADQDDDRPYSFADYGHFMIIHAGIDWQNSIKYNDIPSLFINIEPGKEAIVDGGFLISSSAVVPEYVTGRIRHYENQGFITGFGALNAVFAHEFGHSLGFSDLYNTYNNYPGVGVFDIMDSGGTGALILQANDMLFTVTGCLPTLPSAWTRLLAFEEDFLLRKILVDIDYVNLNTEMKILASSSLRNDVDEIPSFYRIMLSEHEYILLENRSIDPDGDGGTAVQSGLNQRVILHPSPIYHDGFTYEYDWLLPSWVDLNGDFHGGGILAWHIDDYRIYHEGQIINGELISNYRLNRVNVSYNGKKGVTLLEADGLFMIGNPRAYIWSGTPFDYYFKYSPILTMHGGYNYFDSWNISKYHNIELSSFSIPPLKTHNGNPINWKILNFSQADRIMTFEIKNSMFDVSTNIGRFDNLNCLAKEINLFNTISSQVGTISNDGLSFYWFEETSLTWNNFSEEEEPFPNVFIINKKPDFEPILINLRNDEYSEYLLVYNNKIIVQGYDFNKIWEFDDSIIEQPLFLKQENKMYLILVFNEGTKVFLINDQLELILENIIGEKGKLTYDTKYVYLKTQHDLLKWSSYNEVIEAFQNQIIVDQTTKYDPVIYQAYDKNVIFILTDNHKVFKYIDSDVSLIFNINHFTNENPSQLALGYSLNYNSCFILFYTTTRVFVISEDGSLYPGFPLYLEKNKLQSNSNPYIMRLNDEIVFFLHDENQGLLAVDLRAKIRHDYSQYWNKSKINPHFFIKETVGNKFLNMFFSDNDDNVFVAVKKLGNKDDIIWNGYRNNLYGSIYRIGEFESKESSKLSVYVYPNPIKQKIASVRIEHSNAKAKVRVYSTAGQLLLTENIPESIETFRDFRFATDKLATGNYFLSVDIEGRNFYEKFSIIK